MKRANTRGHFITLIWTKFAALAIPKVELIGGSVVEGETLTYYGKDVVYSSHEQSVRSLLSVTDDGNGGYSIEQSPSRAREVALWYANNHANDSLRNFGFSTEGLLCYLDGTCGSWQDFATDVFGCQGIVTTCASVQYTGTDTQHFQVKTNLLGQGNLVPRENTWHDHALIVYNNTIYDPSYGVCYGSCIAGPNDAKHSFIANLNSLGVRSALSPAYYGYQHKYTPTKTSLQITVNDLIFSWDLPAN